MSLIRKLQDGNKILPDLDTILNEELGKFALKSKDERKVRDALAELRTYDSENNGAFRADQVSRRYTVTGTGGEKFEGSPDDIHTNWFTGNLKIKNDQDAMSVAAAIYNNALKRSEQTVPTQQNMTKSKVSLRNLRDYIVDAYGTEDIFQKEFNDKIKNNDERKRKVLDYTKRYLEEYGGNAEKNKDLAEYEYSDDVKNILENFPNLSWDQLNERVHKFKWNLNDFLMGDSEISSINEEQKKANVEREKANELNTWTSRGISAEIAQNLFGLGYNKLLDQVSFPDFTEEQNKAINEYIKKKNGLITTNAQDKYFVFDRNGNPINATGEDFNQFHPLYGKAWNNTLENGMTFLQGKYQAIDYGDVGKGLNIPSYPGWITTGWTKNSPEEERAVDFLGNPDYTKYITLKRPGFSTIKLSKTPQGNYMDSEGKLYPDIKITGFKEMESNGKVINPFDFNVKYWEVPSEFKSIIPDKKSLYNPAEHEDEIINLITNNESAEIKEWQKDSIKEFIAALKHQAATGSEKEKVEALRKLSGLNELIKKYTDIKFKKGGILKAQSGVKLENFAKPLDAPTKINVNKEVPKVKDISSLVRGASTETLAELGLNAGALLPGFIGAGSALAATVLETINDANDDDGWTWKDTGNLALNLGLVGASFVGLGGLRGVVKGAKIGTEVAKGLKEASTIADLTKISKYAKGEKEILGALEVVGKFSKENYGISSLKEIKTLASSKEQKEVIEALGTLEGFTKAVAGAPKLAPTIAGEKLLKGADWTSRNLAYGMAAMNIPNAVQASNKIIHGDFKDLSVDDISSLTAVAFGAKVATHRSKIKIGRKYGVVQENGKVKSISAEINGKTIEITDPEIIKEFKSFNIRPSSKKESSNKIKSAFVNEYNKTAGEDGKLKVEDLKEFSPELNKEILGTDVLRDKFDLSKNLMLQEKGMKWAKKYKLAGEKPKATIAKENEAPTQKTVENVDTEQILKPGEAPQNPISTINLGQKGKYLIASKENEVAKWEKSYKDQVDKLMKTIENTKPKSNKVKDSKAANKTVEELWGKILKLEQERINRMAQFKKLKFGGIFKFQAGSSFNILGEKSIKDLIKELPKGLDRTGLANLTMYANTINTNRYIGDQQRKATANSIYKIPYLEKVNMRIGSEPLIEANSQANKMRSQGARIATTTSDIDKGNAVRLEAENKASDIMTKGNLINTDRIDKLRNYQIDNNQKVDQTNLSIAGKNRGIVAEAMKNINLINSNQALAQNAAFTNLVRGIDKNASVRDYKTALEEYTNLSNSDVLKAKIKEYENLSGQKGLEEVQAKYDNLKNTLGKDFTTPLEESTPYLERKKKLEDLQKELEILYEPIKKAQINLQGKQALLYMKKGGGLTKEDKIELENIKFNHKKALDELRSFYKTILQNNELMQKALIKVFK